MGEAAVAAIMAKNEAQKDRETETIAKERERQRQTELMNRILKGGVSGKGSTALGMDKEDTYTPDRTAEKKISARLGRMDEGKDPFNSSYSSKGLPSKGLGVMSSPLGRAAEPPKTLASLISSHKVSPAPIGKKATPGVD